MAAGGPGTVALYGVDAFTDRPFGGNPAAVCLLQEPADDAWMRRVAAELNQPATAFLHDRRLRWFTPTAELPLCGHATLATAYVLYETGAAAATEPIVFETASGPLRVWQEEGLVWIGFTPVGLRESSDAGPVLASLGLAGQAGATGAEWVGHNDSECVVVLDAPAGVEDVRPDLARIRDLPVSRVLVTAAGGERADYTFRNFAPALGLDEDQATGSAHTALAPLWAIRLGRHRLEALQASGRRGRFTVAVTGERVHVGGRAVAVSRGELSAPAPGGREGGSSW